MRVRSTPLCLIFSVPHSIEKRYIVMEALEIKREVELLSDRLGKTQDYL